MQLGQKMRSVSSRWVVDCEVLERKENYFSFSLHKPLIPQWVLVNLHWLCSWCKSEEKNRVGMLEKAGIGSRMLPDPGA